MVSIVILSWNGKDLLEKCIPSVIEAAQYFKRESEIIVVDNGSTDDSLNYLKKFSGCLSVLSLEKNFGFAKGMNEGIKHAKADIVIGLNNDIIVEKDFIAPLISHFDLDEDLFAVAAKMVLWDKKTLNFGRAVGYFRFGVFRRVFKEPAESCYALYACGGAFAANRKKFLELGGFDEDMIVYWEDLDICYRAWKRGYKTIYEPKSIVYHKRHGTFEKKCGRNGIRLISGENYFLFSLKNFHDRTLFFQQLLSLPFLILVAPLLNRSHFGLGIIKSIKRWPIFFKKRREEVLKSLYSDRDVLAVSAK